MVPSIVLSCHGLLLSSLIALLEASDPSPRPLPPAPAPSIDLRFRLAVDIPLTIAAGAFLLTTETTKYATAPLLCRWCSLRVSGPDLRARGLLRSANPEVSATASDLLLGAVPFAMVGLGIVGAARHGTARAIYQDFFILTESVLVSARPQTR